MAYSYEDRKRAIDLYVKYDKCAAAVIAELGYPTTHSLRNWYKDYIELGEVRKKTGRAPKFTDIQKRTAVDHYFEHGKRMSNTMRALGYPASKQYLAAWIDELEPGKRRTIIHNIFDSTYDDQVKATIALETRTTAARDIATEFGVSREMLYAWRNKLVITPVSVHRSRPSVRHSAASAQ